MAGEDAAYCRRLLMHGCRRCGRPADVVHHRTGAGLALRAHDHEGMPLCHSCHDGLHALNGRFSGWSGARLREWEARQVDQLQAVLQPDPSGPRKRPRRKHIWPKRALPAGRKIPSRPLRRTQRKDG